MPDNFSKYETMRDRGAGPEDVYRAAAQNGTDSVTLIRVIRAVFSLSPRQAKEVVVRAEELADSLDEYQGKIADVVPGSQPEK